MFVVGSDPELILKSRRVIPERLERAGFEFEWPEWAGAARDLVVRVRADRRPSPIRDVATHRPD